MLSGSSKGNYEYLNSRIRSRISSFLDLDAYRNLTRGTLEELEQVLLEGRYAGSYRQELVTSKQSIVKRIETAVAHGACAQLAYVRDEAEGEASDLVDIVLSRGDVRNCRIVLRAFSTGSLGGISPVWHDYGSLPVAFYEEIWKYCRSAESISEKCRAYGHPFSRALSSAIWEFERTSSLLLSERQLLSAILAEVWTQIKKCPSVNGRVAAEYLGRLLDLWNLGLWLRRNSTQLREKSGNSCYMDHGAYLSIERLERSKTLLDLVLGTPWRRVVRNIDAVRPQDYQRELQIYLWCWQMGLLRKNPLGIEVGIGYIARQLVEWQNLNLIAVGIAVGLPSEQLFKRLISVC